MRRVDLHAHTTASDGTLAPADVVALAAETGLAAVAITDHDSLEGIPEARAAAAKVDVEVVPGVELSCACDAGQLHLLGYFLEPGAGPLERELERLRDARARRADRIVQHLRDAGVDVTLDDVARHAGAGAVGRPHVARALVDRGHVASVQEAFDRYLVEGRPGFVPKRMLTPEAAIRLVRESGGVPVLAHPVTLHADAREPTLRRLAAAGLQGVERVHSRQDDRVREAVGRLADELGLVETGGSDFHGDNKPDVRLGHGVDGNVTVPYGTLTALRARRST